MREQSTDQIPPQVEGNCDSLEYVMIPVPYHPNCRLGLGLNLVCDYGEKCFHECVLGQTSQHASYYRVQSAVGCLYFQQTLKHCETVIPR